MEERRHLPSCTLQKFAATTSECYSAPLCTVCPVPRHQARHFAVLRICSRHALPLSNRYFSGVLLAEMFDSLPWPHSGKKDAPRANLATQTCQMLTGSGNATQASAALKRTFSSSNSRPGQIIPSEPSPSCRRHVCE